MIQVNVRVPEEIVAYVSREAKARNSRSESEIWRQLIERGYLKESGLEEKIEALLKVCVQNLCVTQRGVGHVSEDLLEQARTDTRSMLERMGLL